MIVRLKTFMPHGHTFNTSPDRVRLNQFLTMYPCADEAHYRNALRVMWPNSAPSRDGSELGEFCGGLEAERRGVRPQGRRRHARDLGCDVGAQGQNRARFGLHELEDALLAQVLPEVFDLSPQGIIDGLALRRPIFTETAAYGHFGRQGDGFTWEQTPHIAALQSAIAGRSGEVTTLGANR